LNEAWQDLEIGLGVLLFDRCVYATAASQHVSNFGAWRNRHGDIVLGVNDFDEAVVYDFQIDIWRLAVSMYDHSISNGMQSTPRAPTQPRTY